MSKIKYIDVNVDKEPISTKTLCTAVFTLLLASLQPVLAQAQGQWAITGTMQSGREENAQVLLATGGKVLSIGGIDNSRNLLATAEVYNPGSGTWTFTGSMAEVREQFPAIVLTSGKVLVSGGLGAGNSVLAGAELYDPKTGKWSSAGSLSVARLNHTATLLTSGKVLVTGGCTTASLFCTDTAVSELYNPVTNSWSRTGNLNKARDSHTALRLKTGKVLVIGGSSGNNTSCELYDPVKGTWSNAASTHAGRYINTATLLTDGKVLVTGGKNGNFPISSAELYNPTTNTWTQTGSMAIPRYAHTAALLTGTTVLVAGGVAQSSSTTPTAKAEIYTETTGKFTAAASLPRAVSNHSATQLATGRTLVNGGLGCSIVLGCGVVVNNAEVFTQHPAIKFSPSSLNFGLLQIGLSSSSQTVTVSNVSRNSVTITSIGSSGDYSQGNTCPTTPFTLDPGENCTITITFTPTAAGTRTGAVTLDDNDPGNPGAAAKLSGRGLNN